MYGCTVFTSCSHYIFNKKGKLYNGHVWCANSELLLKTLIRSIGLRVIFRDLHRSLHNVTRSFVRLSVGIQYEIVKSERNVNPTPIPRNFQFDKSIIHFDSPVKRNHFCRTETSQASCCCTKYRQQNRKGT